VLGDAHQGKDRHGDRDELTAPEEEKVRAQEEGEDNRELERRAGWVHRSDRVVPRQLEGQKGRKGGDDECEGVTNGASYLRPAPQGRSPSRDAFARERDKPTAHHDNREAQDGGHAALVEARYGKARHDDEQDDEDGAPTHGLPGGAPVPSDDASGEKGDRCDREDGEEGEDV